jgi:hypothetical protein
LWTLIPGFVGVGSILSGILGDDFKRSVREGLNVLLVSAVLFVIFSGIFGAWGLFGSYIQYIFIGLLFLVGIWFIVRSFLRR